MQIPFEIKISNFTISFKSEMETIDFIKFPRSRKFFSACQKIKSDINGMPVYINESFIKYYNTGFIYDKLYADRIFQVDIKSCYASILRNNKLISEDTFKYLSELPKEERLSSVGMMASRKNVFKYGDNGKMLSYDIVKSDYSDYFFYCVQETFKIMNDCKEKLGDAYLFSWVDAIYFTDESKMNMIVDHLKEKHNLESTCKILEQFEVEQRKDFYRMRYTSKGKRTFMNIPMSESVEKQNLLTHLLTKNYNK